MIVPVARLVLLAILGGCAQQSVDTTAKRDANPDKYARDREACRAQVAEMMQTRRRIDDSRRDVFAGQQDRYGVGALPTEMAELSDASRADRLMANCMEARGWPQTRPNWWQRMGSQNI